MILCPNSSWYFSWGSDLATSACLANPYVITWRGYNIYHTKRDLNTCLRVFIHSTWGVWALFQYKDHLSGVNKGILIVKIRWLWDYPIFIIRILIFILGIPTLVRQFLYIEMTPDWYIDVLVQERRNSIANALELRLSCTNPLLYSSLVIRWSVLPMRASYGVSFMSYKFDLCSNFFIPLLDIMLQWPERIPNCIVLHCYNVGHIRCIWHTTLIEYITPLTHYPPATY